MNENFKINQSFRILQTPCVTIRGNLSRHAGAMRAVRLDDPAVNTGSMYGVKKTFQEYFGGVFDKSLRDVQPKDGRPSAESAAT